MGYRSFRFVCHFFCSYHIYCDAICDLLLNRRTATWHLFVNFTFFDSWRHSSVYILIKTRGLHRSLYIIKNGEISQWKAHIVKMILISSPRDQRAEKHKQEGSSFSISFVLSPIGVFSLDRFFYEENSLYAESLQYTNLLSTLHRFASAQVAQWWIAVTSHPDINFNIGANELWAKGEKRIYKQQSPFR